MHAEPPGFWFKSSLFEIRPGEELKTNPDRYGEHLANWLADKLQPFGYDISIIAEDWGWSLSFQEDGAWVTICCGNMDLHFPEAARAFPKKEDIIWHCLVSASQPFWKRLLKPANVQPVVEKTTYRLLAILTSEPAIQLVEEP